MRKERGVVLGIVLVLIACLLTAGVYAFWSLQGESGSAASDRLARQLLDCAEQGLAVGKAYFSSPTMSATVWPTYYQTNVCSTFACPPFPKNQTGTAPTGYPGSAPFTSTVTMGSSTYKYTFGIYNNPDDTGGTTSDTDNTIVVYSKCVDDVSNPLHSRSVSAVIKVKSSNNTDYTGQAGRGFRNQGNSNL